MEKISDLYKPIPGYPEYMAGKNGTIVKTNGLHMLSQQCIGGYYYVMLRIGDDVTQPRNEYIQGKPVVKYRGEMKRMAVHRLIAMAYHPIENCEQMDVNHKDLCRLNNCPDNLEWVTRKDNIRHARDMGALKNAFECSVRDFETGEVVHFYSANEAKRYMGVPINTKSVHLMPKTFGSLIKDRYEFRFKEDARPWFYQNRKKRISTKFGMRITDDTGGISELYGEDEILSRYPEYARYITDISLGAVISKIIFDHPDQHIEYLNSTNNDGFSVGRSYNRKNPYQLWVYDLLNKREFHFENSAIAGFHIGTNRKAVARAAKDHKTLYGRWIVCYNSDAEYKKSLIERFSLTGLSLNSSNCGNPI